MKPSETIVCIGTGPSLTLDQVNAARGKGFTLYCCNLAFRLAPDCKLLYGVNLPFWQHYWNEINWLQCEKWTTNAIAADMFGINWIAETNASGLSQDKNVIHHGHGSGYSLVSMAHRNGAKRIVLLGYDLRYAPDYDGKAHEVGSSPRHYFGEYPHSMQHWPSVQVKDGVHVELLELYRSIAEQGLVEVVNCTPDSAIDCFESKSINEM